jgi:hemolysin III
MRVGTYYDLAELQQHTAWQRTESEERINTVTHAMGLMLAVVGAVVMTGSMRGQVDIWRILGCGAFTTSMIAVFAASTLSHSCSTVHWKSFFRRLDQGLIYFLIVATYTPFGLAYWRTSAGWLLLGGLWTAAVAGFISKVILAHRVHTIRIWTYVAIGCLPMIAVAPIRQVAPPDPTAFWLLISGGACYLVGTLFLTYDAQVRHFHAIWHILVIAGSVCHFLAIWHAVALVR